MLDICGSNASIPRPISVGNRINWSRKTQFFSNRVVGVMAEYAERSQRRQYSGSQPGRQEPSVDLTEIFHREKMNKI